MAVDVSEKYKASLQFPNLPHLHAMIAFRKFIRAGRSAMRKFSGVTTARHFAHPVDLTAFQTQKDHYLKNQWAYIDGVFDTEFHSELVRNWPSRIYFEPPQDITKSYDFGFKWVRGGANPIYLDKNPIIKNLLDYLRSGEFGSAITDFTNSSVPVNCNSFLLNSSYPGSLVIPHMDTPIPPDQLPYINIVYFIDATPPPGAGELGLYEDNAFQKPIFIPQTLRNACIIYDANSPFYHGFQPIKWGKYRFAITSSFSRE